VLCLDEELAPAVACMPDMQHCADCAEGIRALAEAEEQAEEEYERNNARREGEHEPRSAF
jgi:hypothetical protein